MESNLSVSFLQTRIIKNVFSFAVFLIFDYLISVIFSDLKWMI